jgi:hypothetical protein
LESITVAPVERAGIIVHFDVPPRSARLDRKALITIDLMTYLSQQLRVQTALAACPPNSRRLGSDARDPMLQGAQPRAHHARMDCAITAQR